jgi:aspartyl-tRNA synthetase
VEVVASYVGWISDHGLKLIWLNTGAQTKQYLADLGWRVLSVTADQCIYPQDPATLSDKHVQRKVRAVEKMGLKVTMIKGEVSAELRQEIDECIAEWKSSREGTQIHTTQVRPWADCQHRTYFVGRDKDGKVRFL